MNQQQVQIERNFNQNRYHGYQTSPYQNNPVIQNPIIEGYFPKECTEKEMAIREVNRTLITILGVFIALTIISYYFATANEIVLNDLNRQTVILNDENSDLQNKLDNLKSFNNVDITMQKGNLLQKAQQVMEVPAVASTIIKEKKIDKQKPFSWAIGY